MQLHALQQRHSHITAACKSLKNRCKTHSWWVAHCRGSLRLAARRDKKLQGRHFGDLGLQARTCGRQHGLIQEAARAQPNWLAANSRAQCFQSAWK